MFIKCLDALSWPCVPDFYSLVTRTWKKRTTNNGLIKNRKGEQSNDPPKVAIKFHPQISDRREFFKSIIERSRASFQLSAKIIRNCFDFVLLRSMIGLKNSRHLLSQSDEKPKPIATWPHVFSRAWRRLSVFASSSHWFVLLFAFVVIGHCDCFGFGFTTLYWKAL